MPFNIFPSSVDFFNKAQKIYMKNLFFLIDKIENESNHLNKNKKFIYFKNEPSYYEIISNLQICSELLLKKIIFDVSPYALIDAKSYPKKDINTDYNDLASIDAQYLYTMCIFLKGNDVFYTKYKECFKDIYEKNREERNKYIHKDKNSLKDGLSILRLFIIINDIFFKTDLKKIIFKRFLKEIPKEDYRNKSNKLKRASDLSIDRYLDADTIHKVFYEKARFKFLKTVSFIYKSLEDEEREIFFKYNEIEHLSERKRYFCPNCTLYSNIYINSSNINNYKTIFNIDCADNTLFKTLINIDQNNKFKCFCCNDIYILKKNNNYHNFCDDHVIYYFNHMCLECGSEDISKKELFEIRKNYRKQRVLDVKNKLLIFF